MEILIKKQPRSQGATDEHCIFSLFVNGVHIGTCNGDSKIKKYLEPEKWAHEMIVKRSAVLDRAISRLVDEMEELNNEHRLINEP